ncbi:biotin/lipoyl-containing protein [Maribacter sp. 2210JD10-5]|uniref:biotin/lipoyl-containing protein n=1 Tax=Maribacter sp. 2210JD10-5 TaxID=3386272 RepID=UPI0039BD8D9E
MTKFLVSSGDEEVYLSKEDAAGLDVLHINNTHYHILQDNKAYDVTVHKADFNTKTLLIEVNGNRYDVAISDAYDQMVKEMGLLINNAKKENEVKAPMPGLILNVLVKEGQEIPEGTPLLVLSAMKMENIILAQADGIVKSINVKKDDAVEKGQLIIEME